jgi:geranylgeranyl transferase type-2 subunit alpha
VNFREELDLCKLFLQQDHRNFHCWNYRRAIFHRSNLLPNLELEFSTEKIEENFSNYSALHHRSIYIQYSDLPVRSLLEEEFLLVENAIFTEPDDQSAWWYHQFLIQFAYQRLEESQQLLCDVMKDQCTKLQNLLSIEPESKWCMTGIVHLFHEILTHSQTAVLLKSHEIDEYRTQKEELLLKLILIDPNHSARYSYMLKNK